jgi:hypothetical protein
MPQATNAARFIPAAERTTIRSLLTETYDRNLSSQKNPIEETLTIRIDVRLDRLYSR